MEDNNLSPEKITHELDTTFVGQRVIYFPTLDSTMDAARREAQWGAPAGTVIITDEQKVGRGRFKRSWISPRGGLAFSIILRPNFSYLPCMIMLASLAVSYSIETVTGLKPHIKWPNDILIKDKKVCGILIENDVHNNNLRYSIIGVGINVNMHIADFPEIASIATSLSDETGKIVSRLDIIQQFLIEMEQLYHTLSQSETIFEQWKNRLSTLGQTVQVTQGNHLYRGVAESVNKDGSLVLRQEDGSSIKILAGDVTLRRAE